MAIFWRCRWKPLTTIGKLYNNYFSWLIIFLFRTSKRKTIISIRKIGEFFYISFTIMIYVRIISCRFSSEFQTVFFYSNSRARNHSEAIRRGACGDSVKFTETRRLRIRERGRSVEVWPRRKYEISVDANPFPAGGRLPEAYGKLAALRKVHGNVKFPSVRFKSVSK